MSSATASIVGSTHTTTGPLTTPLGTANSTTQLSDTQSSTLDPRVSSPGSTQAPPYSVGSTTPVHRVQHVIQCPEIGVKTGWHDQNLVVDSPHRTVGSTVHLSCKDGSHLRGASVLRCLANGAWNTAQPHCEELSSSGLPVSTMLLIGVLAGCCALVIIVVITVLCKFLCCNKGKKDYSASSVAGTTTTSDRESTSPYYSVSILNGRPSLPPDAGSIHYAKPEVYSSFVNSSFYEDVYARWRSREELTEQALYDSPYLMNRRLQDQCQTPNLRWSTVSLNAHEKYDYGRFGKIPRSHVTETEINDTEELTSL